MKYFYILLALTLTSCNTLSLTQDRLPLNLSTGNPIELHSVVFDVETRNSSKIYILDEQNFMNYELNQDIILNRLYKNETIIKSYNDYYKFNG